MTASICALNTGSPCLMLSQAKMSHFIMLPSFKIQQSDEHSIEWNRYYFCRLLVEFSTELLSIFINVAPTLIEDLLHTHFYGQTILQIPLPHT
jgi:hypothetical protein